MTRCQDIPLFNTPHKRNTASGVVRVGVGGWEGVAAAQLGRVEGAVNIILNKKYTLSKYIEPNKINSIND